MDSSTRQVKLYYIAGELYDWVTDPRALEKMFHWSRARLVGKIIAQVHRSAIALDIGCGTGLITRSIKADLVVGLDINRWNLDRANKRLPQTCFVQCDGDYLPLRDSIADLVVCTEILEHLSVPDRALREIGRVIKREGKLVGSVPSNSPLWRLRNLLSVTHPKSEPFHNNFSRVQLKRLISMSFARSRVFYENFFMNIFFIAEHPTNK